MRIPNIWDNQRYLCTLKCFLSGKSQIIGKFIRLGLFLLQDTAGSTATITEYIEYSLDLEGLTQIFGKFIKSSSEMAKIARPAQETPKFLEQSLCYCTLIEKTNHKFFVVIFRNTESWKIQLLFHCRTQILPIAGNQSNSCTIDHIVHGGPHFHHYTCIFVKIHVLFFSWYWPGSLKISSSTWLNTLYRFPMLTFMNTVYFIQKLYCIS